MRRLFFPVVLPYSLPAALPALLLLSLTLLYPWAQAAPTQAALTLAAPFSTVAERSGFAQTGRYDEVIALCASLQKTCPHAVRCVEFGRSPEGRPMLAIIASTSGALTPAAAQRAKLPVWLVQGGIHAGEIDGKDAGFLALRDLLQQSGANALLKRQVLIFVPVFNVDGHERFGRWNRPNQRGPEQMGWRTTAQNLNLNRDYMKADAPEMQAMLRLVNQWDPLAYIDLHVTDGAKFQHDISIQVEPTRSGDVPLRQFGLQLRDDLIASLTQSGSLPRPFYFDFAVEDDPASGFVDRIPGPRFSHGYFPLRNRIGMLVEAHSWRDYGYRVQLDKRVILQLARQFAEHGPRWREQVQAADQRASQLAGQVVPLTWKTTEKVRQIEFFGYEYSKELSDVSGGSMVQYDDSKPKTFKVPLRDEIVADLTLTAPGAGYLVPVAQAALIGPKLQQHGIRFRRIAQPLPAQAVGVFHAESVEFEQQSFEGRQRLTQSGKWQPETRNLAAGALFVPIAQPRARLVLALFEPQGPDALVSWGLLNPFYERKEYMEAYVAEQVGAAELAANPTLAHEFNQKLAKDAKFANSPQARLEFFARRHPSWDSQYQVYPIYRIEAALPPLPLQAGKTPVDR
jgi:hypothetical protein